MSRAAALALLLASLACQAQEPAAAPATAGVASPTRQQIEATLQAQIGRRSAAIGGFVTGAVLILGGIVVTAVQTVNESEDKTARGDYSDTSYDYTGTLVGLAVAAPILVLSARNFADAQKQIRQARRQRRVSLGFTTEPRRERVVLAIAFGD